MSAPITTARSWTLVACLAFFCATAYAIAVVVFRLPLPGLREPHLFRTALALHVELAVYFWLMATMAAQWAAARRDEAACGLRSLPLLPVVAGIATLLTAASPLAGGTPLMVDYFPWLTGNGLFLAGFVLFTFAVLVSALCAVRRLVTGAERDEWRGAGLSALPVLAALLALMIDLLHGARDPAVLAWGAGHVLLFAHVATMCWEWGRFAVLAGGSSRAQNGAAGLLALVSVGLISIPLLHAPGSADHLQAYTWAMSWLLWPPALLAGLVTLRAVFGARRPEGDATVPARLAVGLAFGFLVVGCLLGAWIEGPTTLVTAHYHAAIGAVALTRMATAYRAIDALAFGRPTLKAVRGQLLAYAAALFLLFSGLVIGSFDAAPRKTSAGELVTKGTFFRVGMSISGVGGLFAIGGSLWLLVNLVAPVGGAGRRQP